MKLRLCVEAPASGESNMERDRALFTSAENRGASAASSAVLRFYSFEPAAISLGFHQREACIDSAGARANGIDVVRRPTGGAAVLHSDEITYCMVAPLGLPAWGRSILSVYGALADCLVGALRENGIGASRGSAPNCLGVACFAATGGHEIAVGGRKLVGSAMRRGRESFLVHGSILAGPGQDELTNYLHSESDVDPALSELNTTHLKAEGIDSGAHDALRMSIANRIAASLDAELLR